MPMQDLPARDRIAEEQKHGAALHLADDGVVRDEQRDERQEEDGQAGEADDDHVERSHADAPRRRAAEERERERQGGEKQGGGEHPAVAESLANFLIRDDQDIPHRAASCARRKCA